MAKKAAAFFRISEHVADRILVPDRLEALLQSVADRRLKTDAEVQARIEALRREAGAAEEKLRRLYQLVEEGLTDLDDMLKERIAKLKADRDKAASAFSGSKARHLPPDWMRTRSPASAFSCARKSPREKSRSGRLTCDL